MNGGERERINEMGGACPVLSDVPGAVEKGRNSFWGFAVD